MTASWRGDKGTAAQRGYGRKWRAAREVFLRANPLCAYCHRKGRITPATVVDHIVPHKGDLTLFWDRKLWQPLCAHCHNTTKAQEEGRARVKRAIGIDGWPI